MEVDFRKVGNKSGGVHVRSVVSGGPHLETYVKSYKEGLEAKVDGAGSMRQGA